MCKRRLLEVERAAAVTCKCVWIPGRQLIRQGADPLSRGAFPFEHFVPSRRAGFGPYHAGETEVPLFLQQVIREAAPSLEEIRSPSDWCHEELEGRDLLLCPALAATRSCLLYYFDAHRRHSASTSALAVVACIASSDWFRLTRYFIFQGPPGRSVRAGRLDANAYSFFGE